MDKITFNGIDKQIDAAMNRFYDNSEETCRQEITRYFGIAQDEIERMIEGKDFHGLYDDDKMEEDVPNILFYEQAESCAISELIQEAFNHRMPLKTRMTLQSIAKRYSQNFDDLKIVDYGAGTGWVSLPLAFMGATVLAYEFGHMGRVLEERIKELELDKIKVVHPYEFPIPWTNEYNFKFDIIICYEVMEHIHDPLSSIVMFNRTLKTGGFLYLTYSFGPSPCSQHLEENYKYHGKFHKMVPGLGFTEEFVRQELEQDFPIYIFEKVKTI